MSAAKPKRAPTEATVRRQLAALQRTLAVVYGRRGRYDAERTNEHGTMTVEWRSGREVLRDKDEEPEGGA